MVSGTHWVGTCSAAPASAGGIAFANITLRMNVRISLGGSVVRLRFSNAHGTQPLTVGAAALGLRAAGPTVQPGTMRTLACGGEPIATTEIGVPYDQRSGRTN